MTTEELAPIAEALDAVEAKGVATHRLRQVILDGALGCEPHRRRYAAVMLYMAAHPSPWGRIELSEADLARTRANDFPCTCPCPRCGGGACPSPLPALQQDPV